MCLFNILRYVQQKHYVDSFFLSFLFLKSVHYCRFKSYLVTHVMAGDSGFTWFIKGVFWSSLIGGKQPLSLGVL